MTNTHAEFAAKAAATAYFETDCALGELLTNVVECLEEHPEEVSLAEDALTTACEATREAAFVLWLQWAKKRSEDVAADHDEFEAWLDQRKDEWEVGGTTKDES